MPPAFPFAFTGTRLHQIGQVVLVKDGNEEKMEHLSERVCVSCKHSVLLSPNIGSFVFSVHFASVTLREDGNKSCPGLDLAENCIAQLISDHALRGSSSEWGVRGEPIRFRILRKTRRQRGGFSEDTD